LHWKLEFESELEDKCRRLEASLEGDKDWTFCGAQGLEKFQDLSKETRLGEPDFVVLLVLLFLE